MNYRTESNKTETRLIEHIDYFKVTEGVWGMKDVFVNFYMVENTSDNSWILIDTGLKTSGKKIRSMADEIFGEERKPSCIILTHAHFDHVGSLKELALEWNVPVYAHMLELPYLTGISSYPPPDSTVGGGLMASLAWTYPKKPINMEGMVTALPADGTIPFLSEWTYLHTPGHAPGHISLFRERDKTLLSGDAIVTTKQESVWSVMLQTKVLSGPPKYFTYDWEQAQASVNKLWMLEPEIIASGHGKPMEGHELRLALNELEQDFINKAVPKQGRYVKNPARANATGVTYIPPKKLPVKTIIAAAVVVTAAFLITKRKKKKNSDKYAKSYDYKRTLVL